LAAEPPAAPDSLSKPPAEVRITGLNAHGDGVGRLASGQVVFVEQALPGDLVQVALQGLTKRVQHATVSEFLEASPQRQESRCPIDRCGGCAIKGASQALQSDMKKTAIVQALRRLGGLEIDAQQLQLLQAGDGWSYRHRIRLHAAYLHNGWRLGYFERHSKTLVPLSMCPVAWPELERLALDLGRLLSPLPPECAFTEIDLAYSRRDARGAASLVTSGPLQAVREDLTWFERSGLSGIQLQGVDGQLRYGNLLLRYDHSRAEHFDLRYEPGMFTQANPALNDALVEAVLTAVRPLLAPRVLELHAGIGNFSVPLARAGAQVRAVESNRRAAIMCQRNGRAPGLQLEVVNGTDAAAIDPAQAYDVLVADPPRSGMLAVAKALARHPSVATEVVYVSCDPATLARDAQVLCGAKGQGPYRLASVQAFDMFAQTPHVETVATFERCA
jgi:23S rRNA (uracil1939-C5)-methyltransferase